MLKEKDKREKKGREEQEGRRMRRGKEGKDMRMEEMLRGINEVEALNRRCRALSHNEHTCTIPQHTQ